MNTCSYHQMHRCSILFEISISDIIGKLLRSYRSWSVEVPGEFTVWEFSFVIKSGIKFIAFAFVAVTMSLFLSTTLLSIFAYAIFSFRRAAAHFCCAVNCITFFVFLFLSNPFKVDCKICSANIKLWETFPGSQSQLILHDPVSWSISWIHFPFPHLPFIPEDDLWWVKKGLKGLKIKLSQFTAKKSIALALITDTIFIAKTFSTATASSAVAWQTVEFVGIVSHSLTILI